MTWRNPRTRVYDAAVAAGTGIGLLGQGEGAAFYKYLDQIGASDATVCGFDASVWHRAERNNYQTAFPSNGTSTSIVPKIIRMS